MTGAGTSRRQIWCVCFCLKRRQQRSQARKMRLFRCKERRCRIQKKEQGVRVHDLCCELSIFQSVLQNFAQNIQKDTKSRIPETAACRAHRRLDTFICVGLKNINILIFHLRYLFLSHSLQICLRTYIFFYVHFFYIYFCFFLLYWSMHSSTSVIVYFLNLIFIFLFFLVLLFFFT